MRGAVRANAAHDPTLQFANSYEVKVSWLGDDTAISIIPVGRISRLRRQYLSDLAVKCLDTVACAHRQVVLEVGSVFIFFVGWGHLTAQVRAPQK